MPISAQPKTKRDGTATVRRCCLVLLVVSAATGHAQAQQDLSAPTNRPKPSAKTTVVQTTIGTEGIYFVRFNGPLEAAPHEENSPVVIRIADVTQDGDSSLHEIRYIGFHAGQYDLCDWLRHLDGRRVTQVPPAMVTVVTVLPEDHGGKLAEMARPDMPLVVPYRMLLVVAALVWTLPIVWWVVRRLIRRSPPIVTEATGPTLADQIAPLVTAILEGHILEGRGDPERQARLERLLLAYWRKRLDLAGCSTREAIAAMRDDEAAGSLLRRLDAWLHEPPGQGDVDVPALLEPYRHAAAIPIPDPVPVAEEEEEVGV